MPRVYVAVGSNIGPKRNVTDALRLLKQSIKISAVSTFYLTQPIGSPGAPPFYNGIIALETGVSPREIKFNILRKIEESLGRKRTADKYGPRPIDLDIIVYNNKVLHEPGLVIPDPDIYTRAFVAVPLFELAPDMIMPDSKKALADIVKTMPTTSLEPLEEFTRVLREEIFGNSEPR